MKNKLTEWLVKPLTEDINIPVNVGDTILTGRFKNKKTKVNSIDTDEHGMPTINGRKVVNFRIQKEPKENIQESKISLNVPSDIRKIHKLFKKNKKQRL